MKPSKGYYCLIQYCPDLSRGEGANIGVLIFCPEPHFIDARVASGNDRIRRFFGPSSPDWDRINAIKQSIVDRVQVEASSFKTIADLERFIESRANCIQITLPRPIKLTNPTEDLDSLFEDLVGGRRISTRTKPLERRLVKRFESAGVGPYLRRRIEVMVPAFQRTITVPFGFQNGRLNLIQPVRFRNLSRETTEAKACRLAIEGRSIFESTDLLRQDMQLFVIGELGAEQEDERKVIPRILKDNKVRFLELEGINELVAEIRETAEASPSGDQLRGDESDQSHDET